MSSSATFLTRALLGAFLALLLASASPAQAAPSVLFAVDAKRGTLSPVAPKTGLYDLTLRGVSSPALYFQNRPGTEQGLISVPLMFRMLFQGEQPHPNAVINVVDARGRQALMGVKLSPPRYDARGHVLRVRVRRLVQGAGAARVDGRTDVVLPRRFGDATLFIDDCCQRPAPGLTVLNPTATQQTVQINNGQQFGIAAAGPSVNGSGWTPSTPMSAPRFSASGPDQGVLGPGYNQVSSTVPGGSVIVYGVEVPAGVASVQLYLFTSAAGGTWVLANNGAFVASGTGTNVGPR